MTQPPFSVLFPAFCHAYREPDPQFYREMQALEDLQIRWHVVNIESLTRGDIAHALKYLGKVSGSILYRGWILHPSEYATLSAAIIEHGGRLHTSPEEYSRSLLFPEFYSVIAPCSIPAAWIQGFNPKQALKAAERLSLPPYFIKDYAKSAKEIWPEGCIVEDRDCMAKTILALKKYRGGRLESGIVIRPLVPLKELGTCPFGGRINEEYRLFYFNHKRILAAPYGRHDGDLDKLPDYDALLSKIDSPFFSADVVVTEGGEYRILEIGDGGCSGLPPAVSATQFYEAILAVGDESIMLS